MEISSTEILKCSVFRGQETLFAGGSFPVSVFHGPEPNKEGCQGSQIESHEFYQGRGAIHGKIEFKHQDLRNMK